MCCVRSRCSRGLRWRAPRESSIVCGFSSSTCIRAQNTSTIALSNGAPTAPDGRRETGFCDLEDVVEETKRQDALLSAKRRLDALCDEARAAGVLLE